MHVPTISDGELRILNALWDRFPLSAKQVTEVVANVDEQAADSDAADALNTVKVQLFRLGKKGLVTSKRDGREYFYSPMISREVAVEAEARRLESILPASSLLALVHQFLASGKVQRDDLLGSKSGKCRRKSGNLN